MCLEIFLFAVVILAGFAVFDLVVGVSNDATNFLTSSIGSKVAPRYVIITIASLGIMAGVSFSSGMMEVARKGIFHPKFFTMPEMLTIFLAVMITDVILLDLFNSFGLPTSTTVSIVFELLGGAVAVSLIKIYKAHDDFNTLGQYINSSKALLIVFGILLSIIVAFIFGAIVQFLSRLVFTFDYRKKLKWFGAVWGGMALSFITYFILVKGAKGAFFITAERAEWISSNAFVLIPAICVVSAVILQILLFMKINIFKPIVLVGTFALAMAFAANDLVNFIGVPMAGYHSYREAMASNFPLTVTMGALGKKVPAETGFLLIAGLIMVLTLWFSKKARTVQSTELSLGQQAEGEEKFESIFISRAIVKMALGISTVVGRYIPAGVKNWVNRRIDSSNSSSNSNSEESSSFDLLRASVNLMVASIVISYATSQKLPLSTTYVTFMVSMGTSFADRAWGRESAVYRITGVITVIGGWFMTALIAFSGAFVLATVIFYGKSIGLIAMLLMAVFIVWKNHHRYSAKSRDKEKEEVFNLSHNDDVELAIYTTFRHTGILIKEIGQSLELTLNALFREDEFALRAEKKKAKKIQRWANIIIANVFKAMRLLQKEDAHRSGKYAQTVRRIQKLADGHRDLAFRAYHHVSNHHKGLLNIQIEEISEIWTLMRELLSEVVTVLDEKKLDGYDSLAEIDRKLRELAEKLNQNQIERIRNGESKTRLTILYYAIVGNALMLSKQNLRLIEIFSQSFGDIDISKEFDMD